MFLPETKPWTGLPLLHVPSPSQEGLKKNWAWCVRATHVCL